MTRFLLISLLLLSPVIWADGVRWQDLPPSSQETLIHLKADWDKLPAPKQEAIAKRIAHWQTLPDEAKSDEPEVIHVFYMDPNKPIVEQITEAIKKITGEKS